MQNDVELLPKDRLEEYLRADELSDEEIATLAAQYDVLKTYKSVIDDNMKLIREILSKHLPNGSFIFGNWRVSKTEYFQKRIDTKKLRSYLGDEYNNFVVEVKIVRVDVKRLEE